MCAEQLTTKAVLTVTLVGLSGCQYRDVDLNLTNPLSLSTCAS